MWPVLLAVVGLLAFARMRGPAVVLPMNGADPMSPDGTNPSYSPAIRQLAIAIARAEGFFEGGSLPARAHNPGSLKIPGWDGPTLGGLSQFGDDDEGWARLYAQLAMIADGRSRNYHPAMSIAAMGAKWAPSGPENIHGAWARNVAADLGVPESTLLSEVLA